MFIFLEHTNDFLGRNLCRNRGEEAKGAAEDLTPKYKRLNVFWTLPEVYVGQKGLYNFVFI